MSDWPRSSDYNEVMQNLATSVGDEELRAGLIERNTLGLPAPYAGNFADVYRINCPATGNSWAVKCFTREVTDLRERYRAISQHLEQSRLSFVTPFHYLDDGVRIAGRWYPIVKMRWIEGEGLNQFAGRFFDLPETLRQLGALWIVLAKRLEEANLAHADLQHGNVLLVPSRSTNQLRLKLVDYDGMYVPALAGLGTRERGHPAYQHPQRLREGTYCPELDRFSHLAIYTALECLATDPTLWRAFDNGQNLLFRENDFRNPGESELFRRLWETLPAPARDLVGRLIAATQAPLEETPRLRDFIDEGQVAPLSADVVDRVAAVMRKPMLMTFVNEPPAPFSSAMPKGTSAVPPAEETPQPRLLRKFAEHQGYVTAVAFAPNGKEILTASLDTTAIVRSAATGVKQFALDGHTEGISSVAFNRNGRVILTGSHDRTAALWDGAEGQQRRVLSGHREAVTYVAFSDDGLTVLTASQDKTALLWDANTGQQTHRFAGHEGAITSAALRNDSRYVLTASRDRTVVLWDAYTTYPLRTFPTAQSVPTSVAFSPRGDTALVGSTDGLATLWDIMTGEPLGMLQGHGGAISAVAFTIDGRRAATASHDNTAALWDIDTFERLQVFAAHSDYVTSVAFSPNGRYLVTGSEDKTALLWDTGFKTPRLRVVGN